MAGLLARRDRAGRPQRTSHRDPAPRIRRVRTITERKHDDRSNREPPRRRPSLMATRGLTAQTGLRLPIGDDPTSALRNIQRWANGLPFGPCGFEVTRAT